MNIVIFQNGFLLGEQIIHKWHRTCAKLSHVHLVQHCALDDLEQYSPKLVILASDMPSEYEQRVVEKCRQLGIHILSVLGRGTTVLFGPVETPGMPGCITCLQLRWENTFDYSLLSLFNDEVDSAAEPVDISPSALSTLGDIVIEEVQSLVSEPSKASNSIGKVLVFDPDEQRSEWITVVPSHDCPRCNLMPDDHPNLARLHFTSHTVMDLETLRVAQVDFNRLQGLFVHNKVGYISATGEFTDGDRYVQADAHIYTPSGAEISGYGAGLSRKDALQSAILEVLERSCGCQAVSRRPIVFSKYSDLDEFAMHPSQFGLHNDQLFERWDHLFEPFDEEKPYSWTWAYSTKFQKPVLIPEQIGYYGPTADEKRFVTETSNGCALGGTVEEATLHGMFEVIERDGFLNMWYAKMPVPELRLGSNCPANISTMIDSLVAQRFDVRLFDISHDLSIPAICAVAISEADTYPKVVSGSSCHLNPYQAVYGALRELTFHVLNLQRSSEERRIEAISMFNDSSKVTAILHHAAVAALPDAYPRWEFLLRRAGQGRVQSVEDVYANVGCKYQMDSRDIRLILHSVLEDLHNHGFDVIVLNQTSAEVSFGGLHAVKTFIPGMTPITFGYGLERVRGLSRAFELPYRMGYSTRILTEADLNQDCHPFS